jgi:AraC-like DNA-binding protein
MPAGAVRRPHPLLRGLVTDYHGYHHVGDPPGVHHGLPGDDLTVVVAFDEPLDVAWWGREDTRGRHWSMVSGLHDAPAAIRHDGFQHGVQLGLRPEGARAILGLPAGALARTLVPMSELLGRLADRLHEELSAAPTWRERFDSLDRCLLALVGHREAAPIRPELLRAWHLVVGSGGTARVADVARDTGWSRRHLTSSFTGEFGLSPKQLARVVRLQQARSLVLAGRPLGDVAVSAGYADQAHLTREWRALAGCTPGEWIRDEVPIVQDTRTAARRP